MRQSPFISILISTRKRVTFLERAIASIWGRAVRKDLLEFVVKVDDDDDETVRFLEKSASMGVLIKGIKSPRGQGYLDLGTWVAQEAQVDLDEVIEDAS